QRVRARLRRRHTARRRPHDGAGGALAPVADGRLLVPVARARDHDRLAAVLSCRSTHDPVVRGGMTFSSTTRFLFTTGVACAMLSLAPQAQQRGASKAKAAPKAKAAATDKSSDWDVTAPLGGKPRTIAFETTEGTWMNVDLSPDGTTSVFDLLGDIYTMPIDGTGTGEATRIVSGPAFDMQPRFSPDGQRIAIASDRGGLWNIWTIDRKGGDARQVSKDTRWFVNSPEWAPDGLSIYARRHFVGYRSHGAGEVWQYHVSGAEGLQVT